MLHAAPLDAARLPAVRAQRFLVGDVPVPLSNTSAPQYRDKETVIPFEVDLKTVPESVLGTPFDRVPVRWEGRDEGGSLVLTVMGEIDPNDQGRLVAPTDELAEAYAHLEDTSITPGLTGILFRGLLRLYNPFSFDVVVTRFDYSVKVGTDRIMRGLRPGFRLRPGVSSDVLLEQSAGLADVAAGVVGAVVGGKPISIDGTIVLRAPPASRRYLSTSPVQSDGSSIFDVMAWGFVAPPLYCLRPLAPVVLDPGTPPRAAGRDSSGRDPA